MTWSNTVWQLPAPCTIVMRPPDGTRTTKSNVRTITAGRWPPTASSLPCGFEYNGPEGHIGFVPRVTPASFRAPFTAAQGWGTFEQTISDGVLSAKLTLVFGQLRLSTFAVQHPGPGPVSAQVNGQAAEASRDDMGRTIVELPIRAELQAGQVIDLVISRG